MTTARFAAAVLALAVTGFASPAMAQTAAKPEVAGFRDCDTCPEMVIVPSGAFVMGTTTPIRIAKPFALARHEVTRAQFAEFAAAFEHEPKPGCRTWVETLGRFSDDGRRSWQDPGVPAVPANEHPVSCVSWLDARDYVLWLARKTGKPYRLPSEAEWEYAARAGSITARPWGDSPDAGCEDANTYDLGARDLRRLGWQAAACSDGHTDVAPVGSLKPNAFGLHDMIGNVAEWVEDCATASYIGRPRDARAWVWTGGCRQRVQRGGSWADGVEHSRSADRVFAEEGERADTVGFRVALDLEPARGDAK